jgi:hypothetical protein
MAGGYDPEGGFDWMVPVGTAVAGAAGGRMLGKGAAKKILGEKVKKGKGKGKGKGGATVSAKELKARQVGLGTGAAGGVGGYEAGRMINDPESVRKDIETAIAIREGIGDATRSAGTLGQYTVPAADMALKAATVGLGARYAHGVYKQGKEIVKAAKKRKDFKMTHAKKALPYGAGAIGTGTADLFIMPDPNKR